MIVMSLDRVGVQVQLGKCLRDGSIARSRLSEKINASLRKYYEAF